jgi:DNA repair ATPase RecN
MSAADNPPNRAQLAGLLRVLTAPGGHQIGSQGKKAVREYVAVAEDTIEAQAAMLRADLTDLDTARRREHELEVVIEAMSRQCDRLKADVAELRKTALADYRKSLEQNR